MATTYCLKRKLYSDDEGMGIGKKMALGGLAVGATFLGAKGGMFGNIGRMAAGKVQMGAGNLLKNKNIYKGGATSYAKGITGEVLPNASKGFQGRAAVNVRNNLMSNFKGSTPAVSNLPAKY